MAKVGTFVPEPRRRPNRDTAWPLQDIDSLRGIHFEAVVHESTILVSPIANCIAHTIAMLLQDLRTIRPLPPTPLVCHRPYHIGNGNIL